MRASAPVAMLLLLVSACGADGDDRPDAEANETTCADDRFDAFEQWADVGFSGSMVVTEHGQVVCAVGAGVADDTTGSPITPETVFAIGSVSKAMTALAVLDLVGDGRLSLADRAGDVVRDLRGPAADATVEQLLLHTSGLAGSLGSDHQPLDRQQAIGALSALVPVASPGVQFEYTNAGYTLLALVVEAITGGDYRDFLVDEVLVDERGQRLGGFWDGSPAAPGPRAMGYLADGDIGATGSFAGPHLALTGNGDVAMSPLELAGWTRLAFRGEIVETFPRQVAILRFDAGDGQIVVPGWVAFDESVYGTEVLAAAGGGGDVGHDVVVAWIPALDSVLVVASNRPAITAEDFLQAIAPAVADGQPIPPPADRGQQVDQSELVALEGTYVLPGGGSIDVATDDRGLRLQPSSAEALEAIFPRPSGDDLDAMRSHEAAVLALLEGGTPSGDAEREAVESDLGAPIEAVDLIGTVIEQRELRSYVSLTARDEVLAWYALDDAGQIQAVELGVTLPALVVAPVDRSTFRPFDPAGQGPDVTVELEQRSMTITSAAGTSVATRS
jgi:CubicO group peptidase (beta-lactamase class C family)